MHESNTLVTKPLKIGESEANTSTAIPLITIVNSNVGDIQHNSELTMRMSIDGYTVIDIRSIHFLE